MSGEPVSSSIRLAVIVAILFAALLATNRWQEFGDDATNRIASDTGDYHVIAIAAPELPTARLPYHHVQRLVVPYAIGVGMKALGIDANVAFRAVAIASFGLAIAFFCAALLRAGVSEPIVVGAAAVYLFNPYVTRSVLTFSGLAVAAVYLVGLSMVIFAVVCERWRMLLAGAVVAAVTRQTAMTFLPALLFLSWAWTHHRRVPIATFGVIAAVYFGSGRLATAIGQESINEGTLTGVFADLAGGASPSAFARAFLEIAIPLLLPLTLLLFVRSAVALRSAWTPDLTALLLLGLGALASPVLMGPTVLKANGARLSALAVPPLLAIVALLLERAGVAWTRSTGFAAVVTCGALVASLHHLYSYGPSRGAFGALTMAGAAVVAIAAIRAQMLEWNGEAPPRATST